MSGLSAFFENQLIDWLLRGQSLNIGGGEVPPATSNTWIGLFITVPDSSGQNGVEVPSANNYSRVRVTSNTTNWAGTQGDNTTGVSSGTSGTTSNNISIRFEKPSGDWGTIAGAGIWNESANGNLLLFGSLPASKIVLAESPAQVFTPNSLRFRLDV